MARRYSLWTGPHETPTLIRWGLSRFGDGHDAEMQEAVDAGHRFGTDRFTVTFTSQDDPLKNSSPRRMASARVASLKRRVYRKHPLFAEAILKEELAKEYYSETCCHRDLEKKRAELAALHYGTDAQYSMANQVMLPAAVEAAHA